MTSADAVSREERERIKSILRFLSSDEVHDRLTETIADDECVKAVGALFPDKDFPGVDLNSHCVRCHKWFDPGYPAGCRIMHAQRSPLLDDHHEVWVQVFGDEPRKATWEEQFHTKLSVSYIQYRANERIGDRV
eukprot:TRINITY_DN3016_c0_g1_i1.p1 TRINITY_DN3016_c0_g1~~TRINITY_DN3016_c0_g1_i1.p1  ORF type:complete len:134 (-),score=1.48 TRINITY_DN3016_c0_g1_i1:77-478(-)